VSVDDIDVISEEIARKLDESPDVARRVCAKRDDWKFLFPESCPFSISNPEAGDRVGYALRRIFDDVFDEAFSPSRAERPQYVTH
jgi:hypothetical protein